MIKPKQTELQDHKTEEKELQSQEHLSEQVVKALREELFALAQGLPNWDIMPPDTLIQRRKTSI